MQFAKLGSSRLEVSRLCLGTMNFGKIATPAESFAIMDTAVDAGINYFDTANSYGAAGHPGSAEETIGAWFAQGSNRRDRVVLATKLYERTDSWPNNKGLSALNIRRACEASLKRLKSDYIDILQMHHVDRDARWEEIWEAFEILRAQGKIIYCGSSNFAGWQIAVAQGAARERHFLGLVSEQSLYNLTQRAIELEVIPSALHHGVGIVPWSPLAGGVLAGKGSAEGGRTAQTRTIAKIASLRPQLDKYRAFATTRGAEPALIAIAWLLSRPGVVAPIVGPRTAGQLHELLSSVDVSLSESDLAELDEIWPGPGGAAPEAYAW